MRTPTGIDCKYFYADYYRGRQLEECRALSDPKEKQRWTPRLCETCPIPGIIRANSCSHMDLNPHIKNIFLGIGQRMIISAYCKKTKQKVKEPEVGCGECHPLPSIFLGEDQ